MAELELITEQHAVDQNGNAWVLTHADPNVWERSKVFLPQEANEVLDASAESDS